MNDVCVFVNTLWGFLLAGEWWPSLCIVCSRMLYC